MLTVKGLPVELVRSSRLAGHMPPSYIVPMRWQPARVLPQMLPLAGTVQRVNRENGRNYCYGEVAEWLKAAVC